MNIYKIHITNFGRLHDFDYEPADRLSVIHKGNGWGKSTLAAFLKAMFYGLSGKGKSIENNERLKYKPWQGGAFGGNISFEVNGRHYALSRIFREKEAKDEFELRDAVTNLISSDYSTNIGQELFGIDCKSFEKTVYIGQNSCATENTGDISARIGSIVELANDIGAYDSAIERLEACQKQYKKGSGARSGKIDVTEDTIQRLNREIMNCSGIDEALRELEDRRAKELLVCEGKRAELEELYQRQKKAEEAQKQLALKSEWLRLVEELKSAESSLDRAMEQFPVGVPEMSELDEIQRACQVIRQQEILLGVNAVSESDLNLYGRLSEIFAEGCPETTEIDLKIAEANELASIRRQHAAGMLTAEENRRLAELDAALEGDEYTIEEIRRIWEERCRQRSEITNMRTTMDMLSPVLSDAPRKKSSPIPFIAGMTALLVGIVLTALSFRLPGAIVSGLGLVLAAAGAYILLKKPSKHETQEPSELGENYEKIERGEQAIAEADKIISGYMQKHGYSFEESAVGDFLQEQQRLYWEYLALDNKKKNERTLPSVGRVVELSRLIKSFLLLYSCTTEEGNFVNKLHELKEASHSYEDLCLRISNKQNAETILRSEEELVNRFLVSYGFMPAEGINRGELLMNIRDSVAAIGGLRMQYKTTAEKLERFEGMNSMAALAEADETEQVPASTITPEIQKLIAELDKSRENITFYNGRIEEKQVKYDEREECRLQKQRLENELKVLKQEHYCYLKAEEHLKKARERIMTRYTEPVFNGFARYYEAITADPAATYRMDANINITHEEEGMQRNTEALSCGYRDLIGLSMRIALIDTMYQAERPVLILDDPFVNLDDNKTALALKLLEKISEHYQVIYLTCSSSRC